ncbi:DUF262 domain-containing protein [Serratia marcescens]|uniref:DUF262 domain-containing protein n=2 Tax=Serratia marcescens TaxID=615 RepID=UPI000B5E3353|nr:DUF262 domain-containing protein [Serratia marcescens]ASL93801.1 hypothetical protein BVG94_14530 [Serratia marcescens]MDP8612952.1 DUF262 domain-containing protein [Serratia marcescens]MDP8616451.1 DUF262 domain-containing protein [Serratia marcescens]MDP8646578.1 DUF262 domain-containing protein [Serratia marcescens]MDP8656504.1 DUF262 domain-containing protein [Serratia marcescens]
MGMIPGEEVNFVIAEERTESFSDDEINKKYVQGEIRIVTEQARYPLNTISSQIVHNKDYKLDPEFQRRHRWDNIKRSALIESLIMNVPIPPIFLYEYDYSSYEVMDGLQRLTAIAKFYDDEFELEGLTQWPELNGRRYSTLPEKIKKGIDRRYVSSIILLNETAKTNVEADFMKQMVFDRINSGGELLTPQEKRNANFNGRFNKFCISLSSNKFLCLMWDIPCQSIDRAGNYYDSQERIENRFFKNMGDVELVLRYFSYRQRGRLQRGLTLEKYLDKFLQEANGLEPEVIESMGEVFEETLELAYELFEEQAFWMYRCRKDIHWSWFERPTTAVYDSLMYALSNNLHAKDKLLKNKKEIVNSLEGFYKDNYSTFEGRNTNPAALDRRDQAFKEFFSKFV